jgi:hypothetical protein
MRAVGVSTPPTALVHISEKFLAGNNILFSAGSKEWQPGAGMHFGSRHPGQGVSVYDFLPSPLFKSIQNLEHFFGAAVVDSWLSNGDYRQAVFTRAASGNGFHASMIDYSEAFNGPLWSYTDVAIPHLSPMKELYDAMTAKAIEPWLDIVAKLPQQVIRDAAEGVPEEWLQGGRGALDGLLETLIQRQRRIGEIIDLWFRGWLSQHARIPVHFGSPELRMA